MPNSTDPKRPSRITPVFVAVCVIAVVFLIVGSILLAFLAMGGANAFACVFRRNVKSVDMTVLLRVAKTYYFVVDDRYRRVSG